MNSLTVAVIETGKIVACYFGPHEFVEVQKTQFDENYHFIYQKSDGNSQYVFDGDIVDRPSMSGTLDKPEILADGVDEATITGLPTECNVTVSGPVDGSTPVTNGTFAMTADIPGIYMVKIESWPYLKQEFEIVAT